MAPKKAKKRIEGGSSNVFSMFEQTQIQEFKEAFTIMDQNRDGFIDKNDLRDTFAALGRVNVKNEEIDEMIKEAPGPINFTVFLTMFGEKLKGADPEETILNAFKVFDPEGKGSLKADYVREMLTTQAERFSKEEAPERLQEQKVIGLLLDDSWKTTGSRSPRVTASQKTWSKKGSLSVDNGKAKIQLSTVN